VRCSWSCWRSAATRRRRRPGARTPARCSPLRTTPPAHAACRTRWRLCCAS